MKFARSLTIIALTVFAAQSIGRAQPKLDLIDGDRIVFVGSTLIEREQQTGYIETMLVSRFPGKHLAFRNVGYSGDTVSGEARGLCTGWSTFESQEQGLNRLRKIIREIKPTVLIINYGMNESFNGPAKLPDFISGLNMLLGMLLDDAKDGGGPGVREVILLSPNCHEDLGRPLPDPAEHDKNLELYSKGIAELAEKRGYTFIDLFRITAALSKAENLTSDGIHLTSLGYWHVADALERDIGFTPREYVKFLPPPPKPDDAKSGQSAGTAQAEQLRQLIVAKNFDFFNYFRPENDSYILSFRKREQGRNAVELPQFKPLAEEKDRQIAELSVPKQ